MTKIVELFPAKTINPETGEEVKRIRALLQDKRELTVLNSIEEIRECGSQEAAIEKLRLKEGKYGQFLQLSRYERTEESIFGD